MSSVPKASTSVLYEKDCLENGSLNYARILNRIYAVLGERGYTNRRRFLTPWGFGVATPFERITGTGSSLAQRRWDTAPFYNSLMQIITGNAQPGRYRSFIIVFGRSIPEDNNAKAFAAMVDLSGNRDFALPDDVKAAKGRSGDHLEVFIYDYSRPSLHQKPVLVNTLQGSDHMLRSGLGPRFDAICARHE